MLFRRVGSLEAVAALGFAHFNGIGVPKDLSKALEFYRQATEAGGHHGQNNLGWCYLHGLGVEKDPTRARELFQKAAQQGMGVAV